MASSSQNDSVTRVSCAARSAPAKAPLRFVTRASSANTSADQASIRAASTGEEMTRSRNAVTVVIVGARAAGSPECRREGLYVNRSADCEPEAGGRSVRLRSWRIIRCSARTYQRPAGCAPAERVVLGQKTYPALL